MLWDGIHQAGALAFVPSRLALAMAGILALAWIWMLENYWSLVLRKTLGTRVVDRGLIRWSFAKSYLSRYAPGKLWPMLIRASDLGSQGVHWIITAKATLIEQCGFILGSALVLLIATPLLFASIQDSAAGNTAMGLVIAALSLWATIRVLRGKLEFAVLTKPLQWLSSRLFATFQTPSPQPFPTRGEGVTASAVYPTEASPGSGGGEGSRLFQGSMASCKMPFDKELLFAIVLGITLALLQALSSLPLVLELMPDAGFKALLSACLAYPSARFIGQVVSLAPGGLGVREGVFVGMVTTILPMPGALQLALWLRLVAVVTELCFLAAAASLYYSKRPNQRRRQPGFDPAVHAGVSPLPREDDPQH